MAEQQDDVYRLLNTDDIPQIIAERFPHLGISASDLKVPTQEIVTKIFKAYLGVFGIVVPDFVQEEKMAPDTYIAEAYSEIMPISNLHYIVNVILEANSFHDFVFSDITHPNPKRTATILAILDNFDNFCDNLKNDLKQDFDDLDDRKEKYLALQKRKEYLRQELNHIAMNRAQRENLLKNNKEKYKQKLIVHDQLSAKQKALNERELDLNSQIQKAKEMNDALVEKIQNLDKKITLLNEEIVPDPENLLKQPALMREQLEQKVKENEAKSKCMQLKKAGIERYNLLIETQQHQSSLLKDVKLLKESIAKNKTVKNNKQSELKSIKKEIESNQDKIAKQIAANQQKQEKTLSLELKINAKDTQMKKSLKAANEEQAQVKAKREDAHARCSEIDKQIIECQKNIDKCKGIQNDVIEDAKKKSSVLDNMNETFFTDLKAVLAQQHLNLQVGELDISSSGIEKKNDDENLSKK